MAFCCLFIIFFLIFLVLKKWNFVPFIVCTITARKPKTEMIRIAIVFRVSLCFHNSISQFDNSFLLLLRYSDERSSLVLRTLRIGRTTNTKPKIRFKGGFPLWLRIVLTTVHLTGRQFEDHICSNYLWAYSMVCTEKCHSTSMASQLFFLLYLIYPTSNYRRIMTEGWLTFKV